MGKLGCRVGLCEGKQRRRHALGDGQFRQCCGNLRVVCERAGKANTHHTMKNTPTHTQPMSCTMSDHSRCMVAITCCVAGRASADAASASGPSVHHRRHDAPGRGRSCESSNSKAAEGVESVASTRRVRGEVRRGVRRVPTGACRRVAGRVATRHRGCVSCTSLLLLQIMLMRSWGGSQHELRHNTIVRHAMRDDVVYQPMRAQYSRNNSQC